MSYSDLKFRYSWRPYQKRVLDAIDQHLDDKRLHIVAAPGAGKTTLGLEVFCRLQKRALVLSPTRTIRDQWIQRLMDFLETDDPFELDWVSREIRKPAILTSITYQALHAQLSSELEKEEDENDEFNDKGDIDNINVFIESLKTHQIEVIIMDEAHHLRSEWWRALTKVSKELPELILVSLTATPPYDAQGHEWNKYEQLCGPIDEEISVPELVKAGTLCPHQDYVWAVDVSTTEKQDVKEYDNRVTDLCASLFDSEPFVQIVYSHPWLSSNIDKQAIIKEPYIAISLLVFIKAKQQEIPRSLCVILDLDRKDIPELGRHWWQILIESLLFSNTFFKTEEQKRFIEKLKKQLRASELLYKRDLSLERSRRIERSLSLSASKISACLKLHELEYQYRGESLRQVILTDYIRDENIGSDIDSGQNTLGAWPIYKRLVSRSEIPERIALLTGRLSIIHRTLLDRFFEISPKERFSTEMFAGQENYYKVSGPLNLLTAAYTEMLMSGDILTLVGTRSLLGEGWDAPVVNSLVLASSVGSFMLTNQMRGRAIRIDKHVDNKFSCIWHLVAIDTESYSGLSDYSNLHKRFETFVGLSEKENLIESGFERLNATGFKHLSLLKPRKAIKANNKQMMKRYDTSELMIQRWRDALMYSESARVLPSVKTGRLPKIRLYHFKNTLKHLAYQISIAASSVLSGFGAIRTDSFSTYFIILSMVLAGIFLFNFKKSITVLRILLRHLPVEGSIKQIGQALASALCQTELIETEYRQLEIKVHEAMDGTYYLSLQGGSFYESSLFANCLAEILLPIDSPRYLIVRNGHVYGSARDDYHAVPIILAAKKKNAEIFYTAWKEYVGPSELVYTRNDNGRAILLKAKMKSFSSAFENDVKRQDRWQ